MKQIKRVLAVLLALVMMLSLSVSAFAEGTPVAEVNGKEYTSISEAITAAGNVEGGGTVKLLADVSDVTIPSGTIVTIDLNGHTISSEKDHAITNNGTLTVTGNGTVDGGSTSGKGALFNNGTATLNGGTFTGSVWYVIKNVGTLTINNGVTVSKTGTESGSAIDNGYYGSSEAGYGTGAATLTINGGTFSTTTNSTVKNDDYGTLVITGGSFTCNSTGSTIQNSGKSATISGGSFTFTGGALGVILEYPTSDQNANPATLTISGGDFTAETGSVLSVYGKASSTVTISGGTFVGDLSESVGNVTVTVIGTTATFTDDLPASWNTQAYGTTGSITVKNADSTATYTAYKIFDVTYADTNSDSSYDAYSYSISKDSAWLSVVQAYAKDSDKGITLKESADGSSYVVTIDEDVFSAADFAEYLYKNIPTTETGTALKYDADTETASVSELALGYYFVTSSVGSLANLTTTDANVVIYDKNEQPPFDKTVDDEDVEIGQTVNYTITGKVPSTTGYTKYDYQVSDTLSEGLTFNKDVTVKFGETEITLTTVTDATATLADGQIRYTDYGFELYFDMTKHQLDVDDVITITYSAVVNKTAVRGVEGNPNDATLEYSNDPNDESSTGTETVIVEVYTVDLTVDKYAYNAEDEADTTTKLSGAKFVLVKKDTTETYYKYDTEDAKVEWVSDIKDATVVTTDANGAAKFEGLEAGTYYLRETEAPAGYNLLTEDKEVTISRTEDETTSTVTISGNEVSVANSAGTELPSTGGMGTTIFYVVGSVLVLGAAILLITKKRMNNVQ